MPNQNWKSTRIAALFSLIFFLGIFLPSLLQIDGMNGGFALSTISGFLMLMAVISALVFAAVARQQDRLFRGEDLLVHWTYTQDEWKQFFAEEAILDRQSKTWLFYIVAFWAGLFGIAFPVYDHENGIYVSYVMLALVILIGCVAFLSIRHTRHQLEKHGGEAYIGRAGAYIAGQMHSWTLQPRALQEVSLLEDARQSLLQIDYLGGNTAYSVRIPIPAGRLPEATEVLETLGRQAAS